MFDVAFGANPPGQNLYTVRVRSFSVHVTIVDPRENFDDLLETESRKAVESEAFGEIADSEVATVGWLVLAFVFDDAGRVLLVDQPWADGWLVPGGVPEPGESLAEAAAREVREETGVEIAPDRPRALDEHTVENERTGDTDGWTAVCFEAVAETTALDDDLGLEDEAITDAGWFEHLPAETHNREWTEPVYRRCFGETPPG